MLPISRKISIYNHSDGNDIKYIVIHDTGNKTDSDEGNASYFGSADRQASAHYFVDDDSITQVVEDFEAAWHVGDGHNSYGIGNHNSIGIEMCRVNNNVTEKTEANTIELVQYLMNKYGIDINHIVRHYDASRKPCPNSFITNNWARWYAFKNKVSNNKKLGWNKDSIGWWYCTNIQNGYYLKDSWNQIDNEWYSFDSEGYARQSKWIQDKGYWYYLKDSCKMAHNEWLWIDGECYYFGDKGGMYANSYTPDGYFVDTTGAWDSSKPRKI